MLRYRLNFEPDDNGTILVTSPDIPIVSYGVNEADALRQADDAIRSILQSRIDAREEIDLPEFKTDQVSLVMSLVIEAKVGLHREMLKFGFTRAELQRRLGWQRESVDRLFRLDHGTPIDRLQEALRAVGASLRLSVRSAA